MVAVNQIGIAEALVNTLLMATFGALALAFGLAFGLGGKEAAAEAIRALKQSAQEAAPKVLDAAEAANQQARRNPMA